jgi:hypothetical protein
MIISPIPLKGDINKCVLAATQGTVNKNSKAWPIKIIREKFELKKINAVNRHSVFLA